jgi:GT2 family glycosyltransferase
MELKLSYWLRNKKIDVVIISYTKNQELFEMTKRCIQSLHDSEVEYEFNVVVIESNKNFYSDGYDYDRCKIVIPDEEFNYNKFCKIGMKYGLSDWVALCNNDLIFQPGWFSAIVETSREYPAVGSFSPWNSHGDWHLNKAQEDQSKHFFGYGIGFHLCGWCIVAKRDIFDLVDLSDDVNFWCSDNIYVDELVKYGIEHVLVRDSLVDHITSQTLFSESGERIDELTRGQAIIYANRNRNND